MKRRKLLKQLGLGLSAGWVLPQVIAACESSDDLGPEVPFDGNVVIIGAGAAGLYTAEILNAKGIKVTLLEAASQIGGRIRSLRNQPDLVNISVADFPVELGAEVIYGTDSIWGTNLKNFRIPTVELDGVAVDRFILDNTAKTAEEWQTDGDFLLAQNFVEGIADNSSSAISVSQAAAALPGRVTQLVNSQVGNFFGASNELIGIGGIAEDLKLRPHDGRGLVIKNNPMQDFLISRFDRVNPFIQLNTPVASINYSVDPIIITDVNGIQTEASKVVVTVPVSILKKNLISFTPALPSVKTSALGRIGMASSIRVVIDFKKNFWGENSGFIWGSEFAPVCFNGGVGRGELFQTLSITINGPKAEELSPLGPDMISLILGELDTIYGGQATQFVRRDFNTNQPLFIIQDWGKEAYIQGGYSYLPPSAALEDRMNLGQSINNRLFFAGEATAINGDAGNINGALASAERVALEIIESITG